MLRMLASSLSSLGLQPRPSFQCRYTGLPPELLAAIFLYLDFFDMVTVTHVCANWRAIAVGYHRLWATIEAGRNPDELVELLDRTKHLKRIRLVLWDRFPAYSAILQTLIARNQDGQLHALELAGEVKTLQDFALLDSVAPFLTYLHLRVSYKEYSWDEESNYEETDVDTYSPVAEWSAAPRTRTLIPVPLTLFPGQIAGRLRTLILGRGVKFPDDVPGMVKCRAFNSVEELDYTMHFLVLEDMSALEAMFPSLKHLRLKVDSCELQNSTSAPAYAGRQLVSFDLVYNPSSEGFSRTTEGELVEPVVLHFFTGEKAQHTRLRYYLQCVDRAAGLWWNFDGDDDVESQWPVADAIIRAHSTSKTCATFDLLGKDGRTVHVLKYPMNDRRLSLSPMWAGLQRLTASRTWIGERYMPPVPNLTELVVLFDNDHVGPLELAFSNLSTGQKTTIECPRLRKLVLAPDPEWSTKQLSLSASDILRFLNVCLQLGPEPLEVLCLQNIELLSLHPSDLAELNAAVGALELVQSPVKIRFEEEEEAWWYHRD